MLVIMGLFGSGESTLCAAFHACMTLPVGQLLWGHKIMSLSEMDLIAVRRFKVGMVFQSFGKLVH
ncbi:MAG: hypothetical protein R8G34_01510 [Paracoccaceae bacterium]|nr:hypothetical protein [Paracoccaceae bacterium]